MGRRKKGFLNIVGTVLLFLILGIYSSSSPAAAEEGKLYLLTNNVGHNPGGEVLDTGGNYKFNLKAESGDSQFEANQWISFSQGALTDGKLWEEKSSAVWGTARPDKVIITFDLKDLYLIKEVKFYTYNGGRGGYYYGDFTLYLSDDGVKYREAGKIDGTTFEEDKNFWTGFDNIGTRARYAAIAINCGAHTRIYEVEIWGSKTQKIPPGAVSSGKDLMSIEEIMEKAPPNPLKVVKENPLFKELLSDSPGGYRAALWTHFEIWQPKEKVKKFSAGEWGKEAHKNLAEAAEAGLFGPQHPWVLGSDEVFWDRREFYQKYGMQLYSYYEHTVSREGVESLVDPVYVKACLETVTKTALRYKDEDFMWGFIGQDEPTVAVYPGKKSEGGPFMQKADKEVFKDYGFNKYGMPAPNDPAFWEHPEDHPFQWIAFNRWAAEKYNQSKIEIYKTIKRINPRFKFVPCDYFFMGGVPALDYSGIAQYCDMVQCDPYAASAEYHPSYKRKGRGIYNHGFGTKLVSDLTGKPVWTVVQAWDYSYTPTPEDIREWASQALRNGATYITFFDGGDINGEESSPYNRPDRYKMMLNIARQMKSMNKIKIPNDPDTAIFFSSDSHSSQGNQATADEVYTAYSLLGEKIGSWFDFISDTQIERGIKSLDKYKVLYIPYGEYQRSSIIDKIEEYVKKGGIVISGDPRVFSWDINGDDLSKRREQIFGVSLKEKREEKEIKITDASGYSGIKKDMLLPIFKRQIFEIKQEGQKVKTVDNAYHIIVTDKKAKIIAAYPDGEPAIVERNYGKGRTIYFAANPFTPESVLGESAWSQFFLSIQKNVGAKTNRDIWRFLLPTENEFPPLVTKQEKKMVEVKKVIQPVLIDGKLDDPAWKNVGNPIRLVEYIALDSPLYATEVYLGWDPQYLYIAFRCLEPEINRMLNVVTEQDDINIFQESSVEIFLDPQRSPEDYYQFCISAKGIVADQFRLEGTKKWNSGIRAAASIGKDCWIAEIAIPIKDVAQHIPVDGVAWNANFVRNRHLKEETTKDVELSTWSVRGSFHQPDQFGSLVFRE